MQNQFFIPVLCFSDPGKTFMAAQKTFMEAQDGTFMVPSTAGYGCINTYIYGSQLFELGMWIINF